MKTRLIYVSNGDRASSLLTEYQLNEHSIRSGNYLFVLDGVSFKQNNILKKIVDDVNPLIQILSVKNEKIIIKVIPEHRLSNYLCGIHFDDLEFVKFFHEMVNYFTVGQAKCWKIGHLHLDFAKKPLIMGILNVTPDSFSDGGKFIEKQKAIDHALEMIEEGVDILDIGGESTRPGAEKVELSQELQRVIPVIEGIKKYSNCFISIDTYKSLVANEALEAGADIINDISGTVFDGKMKSIIAKKKCPVILMHIKGTPTNMQLNPEYKNIHEEIYHFFKTKCSEIEALNDGKIIIDPGIGFGKTVSHNLKLLRDIKDFTFLNKPILIGVSRKSFIGKILETDIDNRLVGSLASEMYSYINGADILRVHDIKETVQLKSILNNILAA